MSIHDVHEGTCHVTTSAVRAGIDSDTAHGAVTPPIVLSSNFSFERFGHKRKYDYTRSTNPTRDLLGEALAELEGCRWCGYGDWDRCDYVGVARIAPAG